jgi:hypothetical protein
MRKRALRNSAAAAAAALMLAGLGFGVAAAQTASPPPMPTGENSTANANSSVTITWNPTPGATSYNIYRSTTSGGEGNTPYVTTTSTSYTDLNLSPTPVYFYEVSAVNSGGESPRTAEDSTKTPPPIGTGGNTPGVASGNSLVFYGKDALLGGFDWFQALNGWFPQVLGSSGSISPGQQVIDMAYAAQATLTFNDVVVPTSGLYTVDWRYAFASGLFPGVTNRQMGLEVNGTVITTTERFPVTGSFETYQHSSLQVHLNAGRNSISMLAVTTHGVSRVDQMTITPATASVPSGPTNLTATSGNGSVTLHWTASSGSPTSYSIYRGGKSDGEATTPVATVSGTTTTFTDTGLTNNRTYFYNVAANNAVGVSPDSNEILATPGVTLISGTNLALNQPAYTSSTQGAGYPAAAAVDDNFNTRWSSAASDPQWLLVDLGATHTISQVALYWESAYAKAFQIQTSNDGTTFTTIYSTTTGTGGTQILNVSGSGRYIRMYGTARGTGYGYSLWEFQVFGTGGGGGSTVTVTNPGSQTSTVGTAASVQIAASDPASGQTLTYSASGLPAGLSINGSTGLISGTPTAAGTSNVTVTATDTAGAAGSASFTWTVNPSGGTCGTTNVALNQPATASSEQSASYPPSNAVDGNLSTRWSSAFSDPQWLEVDLGSVQSICQVVLHWETAYGKAFQIQTSSDNATWATIFSTTTGTGGTQTLNVSGSGRYIRMYGTVRGTGYGYSLWEFQVFAGTGSGGGGNTVTVTNPGSQTSTVGTAVSRQTTAADSAPGQTLTFTAAGLPAGLSISSSGLITGTPTTLGTSSVTVTATDTTGASGSASFGWTVNPSGGSGAPPASFWGNTSAIPAARNVLEVAIVNQTNGQYPDSQVYWSFNGTEKSIAQQPYIDMPTNSSGRMYFYLGSPTSPYYDFIEFTVGATFINVDTTRVDRFGLKLALLLHGHDGSSQEVGENYATFTESRAATFQRFQNAMPAQFKELATDDAPYGIPSPGNDKAFQAGGQYATYYSSYAASVGDTTDSTAQIFGCAGTLAGKPSLCAGLNRHVAQLPASEQSNPGQFYLAAPANYYAQFWHQNAINGLAYGFPYDDYAGQSSDISVTNPQYMVVAVGW